jgi:hypothetical protein
MRRQRLHGRGEWLLRQPTGTDTNTEPPTALANKLARIAWIVLTQARSYEARAN